MKDKKALRIRNKRLKKRLSSVERPKLKPVDNSNRDYLERGGVGCIVPILFALIPLILFLCQ